LTLHGASRFPNADGLIVADLLSGESNFGLNIGKVEVDREVFQVCVTLV
jgi:hypothetical protein